MPELPEPVYIEKKLRPVVLDREIKEAPVWEPIILYRGAPGSFAETLPGKTITDLRRHDGAAWFPGISCHESVEIC